MPWGAAVGAAIGVAGQAINAPDDPQMAPPTPTQIWQGYMAPQYYQTVANAAAAPYTPGQQQVAGFNPNQQQAMNSIMGYSSPTTAAANTAVQNAAAGGVNPYFGMENEYINAQIDAVNAEQQENFNQTTAPMLDAQNTRANTGFGTSSAVDDMRTEAYSDLNQQMAQTANDMYYKDYYNQTQLGEGDAQRQLAAAGLAPSMQAMDYQTMNAQMGVGNQQQANTQAQYNSDYEEFLRQLAYPQQQINMMSGAMGMPSSQPGYMPYQEQPDYLSAALGGAAAGTSIYNMYGQPSYPSTPAPDPNTVGHYGYGG